MYFAARPNGVVGDGDYPLWQVVRASTAAPAYFDPQQITIARASGSKAVTGQFVDGGVSPFNNPALMAMMYATMSGYRIDWPTGADKLLVVSVGTGAADPTVTHASLAAKQAVDALLSLMNDAATLQELADTLGPEVDPIEKVAFSCCAVGAFRSRLEATGARHVVLTGIEAHVCVLMSALDLLAEGYAVHVVADAVTSRTQANWRIAMDYLRQAGAVVTTTETALFQLLGQADSDTFRELARLIR